MSFDVIFPQLGESVDEGTLTRWLKSVGDSVDEYEPLYEVNTEKVDAEIPSPASGVLLEILVPEGALVKTGMVMARLGQVETLRVKPDTLGQTLLQEDLEGSAPDNGLSPSTISFSYGRHKELGFISPIVARIADEHKIDLNRVKGTGKDGRITKKDILAALTLPPEPLSISHPKSEPAITSPALPAETKSQVQPPPKADVLSPEDEVLPLSPVRRLIAEHMVLSERNSPHVSTVMEADLSRIVAYREAHKERFTLDGINLTYTAFFVAATASALKDHPLVNASWSEQGIILHKQINIGMATSLGEEGLIVPVIKNADSLSLIGLARIINDLASRARSRKLLPDEVKGGTFTITNHGVSGSLFATPIINQPQCAILGIGMIQKRVLVVEDAIAIRPMVYISLTFDHRILDGTTADRFLAKVVKSLQNWS